MLKRKKFLSVLFAFTLLCVMTFVGIEQVFADTGEGEKIEYKNSYERFCAN